MRLVGPRYRFYRIMALMLTITGFTIVETMAKRKSEEKCEEYGKLVYTETLSPVLTRNRTKDKQSQCSIVETPLIVGGVLVKHAEFPHMAVIGFEIGEIVNWLCGGSVISESYVLTAAHCMDAGYNVVASKVRAGLTNLASPEDTMQERKVVARLLHPKYALPRKYHDIGLLKLDRPWEFNAAVRPACLETFAKIPAKTAFACGFGKLNYMDTRGSNTLQKVRLDLIPYSTCNASFAFDAGGAQLPVGITSSMLCAGVMAGGKDTCQGDSGGPLQRILTEPYCMYSIIGVTSFGKYCGYQNTPAVYTRVSKHLDWIESTVWP